MPGESVTADADIESEVVVQPVPKPRRPYPAPSSPGRSANMKANRRVDTKPELVLRRALHGLGYRYRKDHRLDLAGGVRVRPDIVFTARRVAVFVDGCFWHCCPEHGSQPSANNWYWEPKLRRNVERDRAADEALGNAGWTVVRLWEHEHLEAAVGAVVAALAEVSAAAVGRQRPAAADRAPEPQAPGARPGTTATNDSFGPKM